MQPLALRGRVYRLNHRLQHPETAQTISTALFKVMQSGLAIGPIAKAAIVLTVIATQVPEAKRQHVQPAPTPIIENWSGPVSQAELIAPPGEGGVNIAYQNYIRITAAHTAGEAAKISQMFLNGLPTGQAMPASNLSDVLEQAGTLTTEAAVSGLEFQRSTDLYGQVRLEMAPYVLQAVTGLANADPDLLKNQPDTLVAMASELALNLGLTKIISGYGVTANAQELNDALLTAQGELQQSILVQTAIKAQTPEACQNILLTSSQIREINPVMAATICSAVSEEHKPLPTPDNTMMISGVHEEAVPAPG